MLNFVCLSLHSLQDHFMFRNHLCISFELMSVNLFEFLKQNHFVGLSMALIRRFAHQILITLRYLKVRAQI